MVLILDFNTKHMGMKIVCMHWTLCPLSPVSSLRNFAYSGCQVNLSCTSYGGFVYKCDVAASIIWGGETKKKKDTHVNGKAQLYIMSEVWLSQGWRYYGKALPVKGTLGLKISYMRGLPISMHMNMCYVYFQSLSKYGVAMRLHVDEVSTHVYMYRVAWMLLLDLYWIVVTIILKTLFNIVEERFKTCWTLMSVLYNDVQKGQ